jgi:hypothetical protein
LYRVAGTQFGIYPSDHAGTNQATAVRFVVSDFDAVRVELLSKGVVFEDYDLGDDFRTVGGVLVSPDGEKTSWSRIPKEISLPSAPPSDAAPRLM